LSSLAVTTFTHTLQADACDFIEQLGNANDASTYAGAVNDNMGYDYVEYDMYGAQMNDIPYYTEQSPYVYEQQHSVVDYNLIDEILEGLEVMYTLNAYTLTAYMCTYSYTLVYAHCFVNLMLMLTCIMSMCFATLMVLHVLLVYTNIFHVVYNSVLLLHIFASLVAE
jgi:hypothetical protein